LVFFIILLIYFSINSLGFLLQGKGLADVFRAFTTYYYIVFLGYLLYEIYYKTNQLERLLKYFVRMGVFISVINILHFVSYFVLFKTNFNYSHVNAYLDVLNPTFNDYIETSKRYNTVGFVRHVGYFFDMHSQYFIPLLSLFVILVGNLKMRLRSFCLTIIVLSILLSGIKTAYLTLVFIYLIYWVTSFNLKKFGISFLLLSFLFILFYSRIEFVITNLLTQNHSIYSEHLLNNPTKFYNYSNIGFFIGGNPEAFDMIYTEVSFLEVWYSIGIFGMFFFVIPGLFFFFKKFRLSIGWYSFLVLILSLSHYGVFNNGINNFASALVFLYFIIFINSKKNQSLSVI
jgi:hypothetical protein